MNYLDALFKDIPTDSYKTNKVRRKAWDQHSWIESGEHGQMRHYWKIDFVTNLPNTIEIGCRHYKLGVEMLEDDWEVYHE